MLFDCLKKLYTLDCFGDFAATYRFKVVKHSKSSSSNSISKCGNYVTLVFYNKESKNNVYS